MNLVHKDGIILALTENKVIAKTSTVFSGTKEECEAEIARLGLVKRQSKKPGEMSANRTAAADYFRSLPAEVQTQFGALFRIISAIPTDPDAAKVVAAIAVPDALTDAKAKLVELLT